MTQEGKASMGELLNAKKIIAENYGDCDWDLELQDIIDEIGGFLGKAVDVGGDILEAVADYIGGLGDWF